MPGEFQKDVKFDDIRKGDLIVVELFSEDNFTFLGDRRGYAVRLENGVWSFSGMKPLYQDAKGYRLFRVEPPSKAEAELERLRKIENGLKEIVESRKKLVETLRAEAVECESMDWHQTARFNRDSADRLMAEVWPLEALLNG